MISIYRIPYVTTVHGFLDTIVFYAVLFCNAEITFLSDI